MTAPQLLLEEEVFTLKIINPNLRDRFYLFFQNLVCKYIRVQSSRRVLSRLK